MNAPLSNTAPIESSSPGSHPSEKEIALLAFEHWKKEGCSHLRPEHWLTAEKDLMAAYAEQKAFVPADAERLEEFWVREMETASCYALDSEHSLTTKGWS